MKARVKPNTSQETLLSYQGNATGHSMDCLLELAEHKLNQQDLNKSTRRRVFKIMVETLQNTYQHLDGSQTDRRHYPVNFSLIRDKLTYTVSAGNHVKQSKVRALRNTLERYNAMSLQELKEYYLKKLRKGQFSREGGAGLGFVDIMRRSGKKISYSFKPVNKDYSYFSLQVKVSA